MANAKPDLLQGTLDLLILKTLRLEANHGWGISQRIQQLSQDVLAVNQGSLYPALARLEEQGLIEAEWGVSENNRRARFYSLTKSGRRQLDTETAHWQQHVGGDQPGRRSECDDALVATSPLPASDRCSAGVARAAARRGTAVPSRDADGRVTCASACRCRRPRMRWARRAVRQCRTTQGRLSRPMGRAAARDDRQDVCSGIRQVWTLTRLTSLAIVARDGARHRREHRRLQRLRRRRAAACRRLRPPRLVCCRLQAAARVGDTAVLGAGNPRPARADDAT